MKQIKKYIKDKIVKELELNKVWKIDDEFYKYRNLSIDQRGRIGEHLLRDIFEAEGYDVKYVDNDHGDYDIEVGKIKIEVKTASLDVNFKFQHEGIKNSKKWDMIALVDIAPNDVYINFYNKYRFSFDGKAANIKISDKKLINLHYRGKDTEKERATGAGYKFDLKEEDAIKGIVITNFDLTSQFEKELIEFKKIKSEKTCKQKTEK